MIADQSVADDDSMMDVPNLLVTDDDKAFRKVVCEGLQRRGFRVIEACDGREALDLIARSRVHVAVVDVPCQTSLVWTSFGICMNVLRVCPAF